MAKKKTVGNVIELDLPLPPVPEPVVKKKKELSDKQRENLSKGMAILKAKREAKSKQPEVEEVESTPEPVIAPPVVAPVVAQPKPVKERKPRVVKNFLTTEDFNSFKTELFTSLRPMGQQEYKPQPVMPVVPVVPVVPVTQPVVKERVISGRELLDKIFFK